MDAEGFGNCTNTYECEAVCPAEISASFIAKLNREYARATIRNDAANSFARFALSGERTRLACWFRRHAESILSASLAIGERSKASTRDACAPQSR